MTAEKEILIWARAVYSLAEGKRPKERAELFGRLAEILQKKRKTYLLPKIIKKLEMIFLKKNKVELSFARDHSPAIKSKIKEKLFKIIGKEKNVEIKTEKELIGGFRAKTSNLLVKASIKDFLDELRSYGKYRII